MDVAEYPMRKHPRLKGYDYSQGGAYFLTLCARDKARIFAPGTARPTHVIPRIVAALKRFSNRDTGGDLWQTSFHDHIIRDEHDYLGHWAYIDANPARWTEDEYYIK